MALTKDFSETVRASAQRDPAFRRALFCEALEMLVNGEHELAKAVLRKFINATVGFEELAALVGIPSKSLHRMFGPRGNPSLGNLASVISALRRTEKVHVSVSLSKQTQATAGVAKWGNSLAVRLPDAVVKTLELKSGDEIAIVVTGKREFRVERDASRDWALARLRALRRPMPKGFRFDRDEANAR
jgi:antitoxin component of MazEF toxin-antitoxin module/DNA-binding phage protein